MKFFKALMIGVFVVGALGLLIPVSAQNSAFNLLLNDIAPSVGTGATGTGVQRVQLVSDQFPVVESAADGMANPDATKILSFLMCWTGTVWDRCRAAAEVSVKHYVSVGVTEDEFAVKVSAGTLMGMTVTNHNAAVHFLRCSNLTAANTTPGTSVVFWGGAIPGAAAGQSLNADFPLDGIAFSTALTCWIVTGEAETDVAEVAANDVQLNIYYR